MSKWHLFFLMILIFTWTIGKPTIGYQQQSTEFFTPIDWKQYTLEEEVEIVKAHFESKLVAFTQQQFPINFPEKNLQVDSQLGAFCRYLS